MSARRPARPDLALTNLHQQWVPSPGQRVRQPHQTSHTQVTRGTAYVLMVRDDARVDVSLDPTPMQRPGEAKWATWPLSQTIAATAPTDSTNFSPSAPGTVDAPAGESVPEECEVWGCDGHGWSHQGTSYKSGEAEKQYAPCGRRCGRVLEADFGTP